MLSIDSVKTNIERRTHENVKRNDDEGLPQNRRDDGNMIVANFGFKKLLRRFHSFFASMLDFHLGRGSMAKNEFSWVRQT